MGPICRVMNESIVGDLRLVAPARYRQGLPDDSSDAIVRAYLEAVQAARRTPAAAEPWRRVAALLATDVRWRFAGGAGRRLWPVELNGQNTVLQHLRQP